MIRLMIADDHAIVRSGLKQIFALMPEIQVVAEATNGAEVLERLRLDTPDLLLLDLNMPGIAGADLIQRIRAHWAELPILVLSMHNEAQVATRVLKAGANGFITKDCEPDILLSAIRKVADHGRYLSPDLAERVAFDATASPESKSPISILSERELEVFRQLTRGKSVNDIAGEMAISNKTVSTHKVRLMEKLELSSMADLMRYAMQHNLLD